MPRLMLAFAMAAVLAFAAPAGTAAQETPTDTVAVLLQLAENLHDQGQDRLAESLLELIRDRFRGGAHADRVAALLEQVRSPRLERAGRTQLVAWNTVFGAWLGIAIPSAFNADDPEAYGAGLLLLAPGGFALSKWYASNHRMTSAQAAAATFGSMFGTWQAIGWQKVLDIGQRTRTICPTAVDCFEYTEDSETAPYAAAVIGGLTGMLVGPFLAGRADLTAGAMTTISHGAYWGTWYGLAIGVMAGAEDDDVLAASLLGGNGGMLAAAALGTDWGMTTGQVWMTTAGGLAGLVAGLGIDLLIQPDNVEAAFVAPTLGSLAGLALGRYASRNGASDVALNSSHSLLGWEGGRLAVGMPLPLPAPVTVPDPQGGWSVRPGVAVRLFSGAF